MGPGSDLYVPATSQTGFASDYNLLYATAAASRQLARAAGDTPGVADGVGRRHNSCRRPQIRQRGGPGRGLGYGRARWSDDNLHVQSLYGSVKGRLRPSRQCRYRAADFPPGQCRRMRPSRRRSTAVADRRFCQRAGPQGSFVNLGWDGTRRWLAQPSPVRAGGQAGRRRNLAGRATFPIAGAARTPPEP